MVNSDIVTFILVRHGRTALNTEGRFRGLSPVPPDEEGIMQANRESTSCAVLNFRPHVGQKGESIVRKMV